MSNEIPTKARRVVSERSHGLCERCGGRGGEIHHRRRRRVSEGHDPHCPCNLVRLCPVCHATAHANPRRMQEFGWIVSAHETEPYNVPVLNAMWGWVTQNCDGTFVLSSECDGCGEIRPLQDGTCATCLEALVCCGSAFAASRALCDCGGGAATALMKLRERMKVDV